MKPFSVVAVLFAFLLLNSACVSTSSNAYSEPSLVDMQRTPPQDAARLHPANLSLAKNFEIQIVSSFDPLQIVSGFTADTSKLGAVTQTKSSTQNSVQNKDSAQMLIPIYGSHSDFAAVGERDQLWCLTKAIQDGLVESIQIEQQSVKNSWGLFRDSFHAENGLKTIVHLSSGATAVLGSVESADVTSRNPTAAEPREPAQALCTVLKTSTEASRNHRGNDKVD